MWKDVARIQDIPTGGRFRAIDKRDNDMLGPYRDAALNTLNPVGIAGTLEATGERRHHILTNQGAQNWRLQVWQDDVPVQTRSSRFKRIRV